MDTKLKNRHKLGIFVIWAIIIGAASLMLCFYPGIVKDKNRQNHPNERTHWNEQVENTCAQMVHWPYVLWMNEMEENAEKALTPSQVFAPGLVEWINRDMTGAKEESSIVKIPSETVNAAETEQTAGEIKGTERIESTQAAGEAGETEETSISEETGVTEETNIIKAADIVQPEDRIEPAIEENALEESDTVQPEKAEMPEELYLQMEESRQAEIWNEERCQYIRQELDDLVRNWQTNFGQWDGRMQYQVLDQNKEIIHENDFLVSDRDWLSVEMHYDQKGRLDGVKIKGSSEEWLKENREETIKIMEEYLTEFYYREPLQDRFEEEISETGLHFTGPVERTYLFVIPTQAIFDMEMENPRYWYGENSMFLFSVFWIAAAVALSALLLPGIPSLNLGCGKISRVPMEIVVTVLGFLMPLGYLYGGALLGVLEDGSLAGSMELLMGISSTDADTFAFGIYLLYWIFVFGIGYWCVHCLSAFIWIRPVRYLRERTVIGLFCGYVARIWHTMYDAFCSVDLEKKPTKMIFKAVLLNFVVLAVISCFWMFGVLILILYSIGLFFLLTKYWSSLQKKYDVLMHSVKQMADGKLDTEITEDVGIFEPLKEELKKVQQGFKKAVEEETKSQRMKTELITNVSHDLKTPLTAIVTYVNLLKKDDITEEERQTYIEVLDKKSMRLKTLIEDLFEVSKAASRTVQLNLVEVDIVSLLKQVRLELTDRLEASGVTFRWEFPQEKVILMLDSEKTYRIFENLLVNIAKYGMAGTRAYIEVHQEILEERELEEKQTEETKEKVVKEELREEAKEKFKEKLKEKFKGKVKAEVKEKLTEEVKEGVKEEVKEEFEEKDLDNKEKALDEIPKVQERKRIVKKHVWISMKNISSTEFHMKPEELTERFVRGDESRNTEGSGLGLAIAKNFVEAQGGEMKIEVEADLFKVLIDFGVCEMFF